jgi:hypothetical protein
MMRRWQTVPVIRDKGTALDRVVCRLAIADIEHTVCTAAVIGPILPGRS